MSNTETHPAAVSRSRILVLGATGGTGRQIVRQARTRGHDVAAPVHSPGKARDLEGA